MLSSIPFRKLLLKVQFELWSWANWDSTTRGKEKGGNCFKFFTFLRKCLQNWQWGYGNRFLLHVTLLSWHQVIELSTVEGKGNKFEGLAQKTTSKSRPRRKGWLKCKGFPSSFSKVLNIWSDNTIKSCGGCNRDCFFSWTWLHQSKSDF